MSFETYCMHSLDKNWILSPTFFQITFWLSFWFSSNNPTELINYIRTEAENKWKICWKNCFEIFSHFDARGFVTFANFCFKSCFGTFLELASFISLTQIEIVILSCFYFCWTMSLVCCTFLMAFEYKVCFLHLEKKENYIFNFTFENV